MDTGNGWKLERISLTDNGKRPDVFLTNASTGVDASYMLEFDPPYYNTSEDCRNDSLGGVMHGLSKATVADKLNDKRLLKNGQTLAIGSFLIKKADGIELNQQNVWGFYAKDHTCATIHLSKTPFHPGDASPFDALLDGFTYDPTTLQQPPTTPLWPLSCRQIWHLHTNPRHPAATPRSRQTRPLSISDNL